MATVPGLRGHIEDHRQTRLAADRPDAVAVRFGPWSEANALIRQVMETQA